MQPILTPARYLMGAVRATPEPVSALSWSRASSARICSRCAASGRGISGMTLPVSYAVSIMGRYNRDGGLNRGFTLSDTLRASRITTRRSR